MDWYLAFIACVTLLWVFSTPADRNAARIVLIASLASECLVDFITSQIAAPWKLAVPGAVEVLTICALLRWSRNRTGYWQAGLLGVAWLAHVLCYVDLVLRTDLVYSSYEVILWSVMAGQLIAFHDTSLSMAGRFLSSLRALRGRSEAVISVASVCPDLSSNPSPKGLQTPH